MPAFPVRGSTSDPGQSGPPIRDGRWKQGLPADRTNPRDRSPVQAGGGMNMFRSIILLALVVATTGLSAQGRANRDRVQDDFGLPADAWCAQTDRGNRSDRSSCDVREESV